MRVFAVIAEYNPFHLGHLRQLELMREAGADMIVAVMSGNFVQRGEPAVFDKFARTEMALSGGADLVVEIPAVFSSSSAREFAAAGVALTRALGMVDTLCFGVENGIDPGELTRSVDITKKIDGESEEFGELMRSGLTYPEAADRLFRKYSGDEALADRMRRPNNILAAEYLRALSGSGIRALPIARDMSFRPSSGIREDLEAGETDAVRMAMPDAAFEIAAREIAAGRIVMSDDMSGILSLRLLDAKYSEVWRPEVGVSFDPGAPTGPAPALSNLTHSPALGGFRCGLDEDYMPRDRGIPSEGIAPAARDSGREGNPRREPAWQRHREDPQGSDVCMRLSCFLDVSEEMEGRLLKGADSFMRFGERALSLKTRQYTLTRVRRALLHIALGVSRIEFEERRAAGYMTYIRVLGFSERAVSGGLMKELKDHASLPIVVKTADHKDLIARDIYRDGIYYSLKNAEGEYTRSPVVPL